MNNNTRCYSKPANNETFTLKKRKLVWKNNSHFSKILLNLLTKISMKWKRIKNFLLKPRWLRRKEVKSIRAKSTILKPQHSWQTTCTQDQIDGLEVLVTKILDLCIKLKQWRETPMEDTWKMKECHHHRCTRAVHLCKRIHRLEEGRLVKLTSTTTTNNFKDSSLV